MTYYILTGETLNSILTAVTPPVMNPVADPLYPATQLYDGKPYLAAKFGTAVVPSDITADLNAVPWPGFEATTGPADTAYAATWGQIYTTRDTAIKNSGAASLRLNSPGGTVTTLASFLVTPGQRRKLEWAIRGDASVACFIRAGCFETGRYLTSIGTWTSSGLSDVDTQTAAAFKTGSIQYTVESFATCGYAPLVRMFVFVGTTGAGWLDDIYDYPATDFCGAFGTKNWDAAMVPELRSSTDNFTGSDVLQSTMAHAKPVISVRLAAPVYHRYWRLRLPSFTGLTIPGLGELVLGQSTALLRSPNLAPTITWKESGQIRRGALSGAMRARNLSGWPTREVELTFRFKDQASFRQHRDELWRGSRGGAIPAILISSDATQGVEYPCYGMLSATFAGKRGESTTEYWDIDATLEEQPFPNL
jgi:hypothetical protein